MTGVAAAGAALLGGAAMAQASVQDTAAPEPSKLFVVWSSGDPDVAHRVCLMYSHAAKTAGWFKDVKVIIWGPSQRIFAADKDLQAKINAMRDDGIEVEACIACANSFGLVEQLREMGLKVIGQGGPLTAAMKDPDTSVAYF